MTEPQTPIVCIADPYSQTSKTSVQKVQFDKKIHRARYGKIRLSELWTYKNSSKKPSGLAKALAFYQNIS